MNRVYWVYEIEYEGKPYGIVVAKTTKRALWIAKHNFCNKFTKQWFRFKATPLYSATYFFLWKGILWKGNQQEEMFVKLEEYNQYDEDDGVAYRLLWERKCNKGDLEKCNRKATQMQQN